MKRPFVFFCIFLLAGIFLAVITYSESLLPLLYFFWKSPFLIFIRTICILLFVFLLFKKIDQKLVPKNWLKFIFGIIFLPVLFLPILRCYFRVPYIFCRACPNKCPWGMSRTFFFDSFIALNLSKKFWCANVCPFGAFQECQAQISKKNLRLPAWLSPSSYLILFILLCMYLLTFLGLPAIKFFGLWMYAWAVASVSIAVLVIAAAFFVPRIFCRYICPVGTIAELSFKFKRWLGLDKHF